MKQTAEQDKGVSATAAVAENLKSAGATVQESFEKAGATMSAQADKVKAGGEEGRMRADLTKDTRQADASDRAEAKKAQYHAEAEGGGHQEHSGQEHHPPPYTKTPFV